jgi:UDP-N-acetyl-D-mannosaminuronate dehydrogenase
LPVDPSYLSWAIKEKSGSEFRFVSLANDVNSSMPSYVVGKAREILRSRGKLLAGAVVVLLGLSYKSGSGDTRESPSLRVAELLAAEGCALSAVDEHVRPEFWPDKIRKFNPESTERADLAILLTDHPTNEYERALGASDAVLDTRNVLRGGDVVQI